MVKWLSNKEKVKVLIGTQNEIFKWIIFTIFFTNYFYFFKEYNLKIAIIVAMIYLIMFCLSLLLINLMEVYLIKNY